MNALKLLVLTNKTTRFVLLYVKRTENDPRQMVELTCQP